MMTINPTVKCNRCGYYFTQIKPMEFTCQGCLDEQAKYTPIQAVKCDCGGDKLRLPHFDWCSKKKQIDKDKMEAYKNEVIW
jgi:ribosomal protein S27E